MHAIIFTLGTWSLCGLAGLIYYKNEQRNYRAAVAELRLRKLARRDDAVERAIAWWRTEALLNDMCADLGIEPLRSTYSDD